MPERRSVEEGVWAWGTKHLHPPKAEVNPLLYLGFLITALGAGMVLYFKPQG